MADIEKSGDRSMVQHSHDETDTTTSCGGDGRTSSSKAPSLAGAPLRRCPDGGLDAWLTVFGAFLALFCTFGQLNAFGTFQTWYAGHQLRELPPSTISWIGSLQLWIFFFSGGFIGRWFDAYGPRVIMIPGTLILVFSIMMTSLATQYYQYILAQGIVFGLGVGMIFYPSLSAISTHFSRYRGTALGVAFTGSGVGGVVYPIMFKRLFDTVGFAWAVRISGFISLVCCVVAICTVTSFQPPVRREGPWLDIKHFRDVPFMLVVSGSIFICLGLFIPFFYIADYAEAQGLSANTAFYILSAMNGGGIVGRLAPPLISDVVGRFNVITPCAFLLGLSALVFWIFAKSLVSILLFAILYGFLSGAFIAMLIPCVAQISEGEKLKEIGTRIGMLYSMVSFAALAGGPAAGAILKANHGSYNGMIVLCGVANIAGSLLILWSRCRMCSRLLARV
ncbi:MFS general substrate transporter [Lentinus tigrinus ALCF2SS1-7]|uniref:MFS general substrate transporter n=1 Tax=Lentinus tigrinus ALCF2SS1-6 TaxID=1328759 RepID=A0A5C2S037_9APHY|nr:MFS general substrate transporter [Lentinus tigrinus ALCF2SS1-6]RPD71569.1 MFS general substrate transporter [Lentinus tigrinus ALCF2SS1-7]